MRITVIGMGKIGLPLAIHFTKSGNEVLGLDNNNDRLNEILVYDPKHFEEPNLHLNLKELIDQKKLNFTSDTKYAIQFADVIVVCIPLLLDEFHRCDFRNIDGLVTAIGEFIKAKTLICFETTLPVGTTRNRFSRIIEDKSKLEIGKNLFIVFSPERVSSGSFFKDLLEYPKLVGGVTSECTVKGVEFYKSVLARPEPATSFGQTTVIGLRNSETAEFVKIAETTYRDVNIGLANEFASYSRRYNIDITEVIKAANSQPYSHIHDPGISVGGHCIPVYPHFYLEDNEESKIVFFARQINDGMPNECVQRIKNQIGSLKDLSIGVLGISYREGIRETSFSGALKLLDILLNEGCKVFGFDPNLNKGELQDLGFEVNENLNTLDGLILHTYHEAFLTLDFNKLPKLKFIFDGRNMIDPLTIDSNKITLLRI